MSRKSAAKRTYTMRPPRPRPQERDIYHGLSMELLSDAWGAIQDGEATPEQEALLDDFFARGGSAYAL